MSSVITLTLDRIRFQRKWYNYLYFELPRLFQEALKMSKQNIGWKLEHVFLYIEEHQIDIILTPENFHWVKMPLRVRQIQIAYGTRDAVHMEVEMPDKYPHHFVMQLEDSRVHAVFSFICKVLIPFQEYIPNLVLEDMNRAMHDVEKEIVNHDLLDIIIYKAKSLNIPIEYDVEMNSFWLMHRL